MKLRDLFVSIGFNVDDKQLKSLDKGLAQTKTLVLAVGGAAVAAAGSLYVMARSVADMGDEIAKEAARMGINLELLQEFQYAGQLAGMSVEELNMNMEQFVRRAADAADGTGEAKAAFAEMGISARDANGHMKSTDRLLGEVADKFVKITDGSKKVSIAYNLFGRSGIGMINLLNEGSAAIAAQREEARRLGVVISEPVAHAAEKFQDDLLRAKSVIAGIKNQVGGDFIPVMIDLLVQFRKWALYNREIIKSNLEKYLHGAIALLRWLYRTGREVVGVLGDLVEVFGGIERAAQAAAWAIGLFAGLQVLSAIGNLVLGIGKLVGSIRIMGNAALIANLKVLALPVLMGAAVMAVILAIQDLYRYVRGEKSLYGYIIDKLLKDHPLLQKVLKFSIGDAIAWIREQWEKLTSWMSEKLQALLHPFSKLKGYTLDDVAAMANAWDVASGIYSSPAGAPAAGPKSVSRSQNVNVNAPITVNVPEGTPADMVASAVQSGVSDGLARTLRDASLATEPAVEW